MDTETTQVRPPEYGEADGSRVYPFKRGSVVIDADDDRAVVEKHSLREKAWVLVRYITGPCKGRTMYQMERNLSDANSEGHGRAVARTVHPLVGHSES